MSIDHEGKVLEGDVWVFEMQNMKYTWEIYVNRIEDGFAYGFSKYKGVSIKTLLRSYELIHRKPEQERCGDCRVVVWHYGAWQVLRVSWYNSKKDTEEYFRVAPNCPDCGHRIGDDANNDQCELSPESGQNEGDLV